MIIYNVTVKIDPAAHDDWFNWMKTKHIPDVMKTGFFSDSRMAKVLIDEEDGVTYSIQYRTDSFEKLDQYHKTAAPALQKEHTEKYEGKFVAFRTLLEEV